MGGWIWCSIETRFQHPKGHAAASVWALSDRVDVGVLVFWRDCFGPLRRYVPTRGRTRAHDSSERKQSRVTQTTMSNDNSRNARACPGGCVGGFGAEAVTSNPHACTNPRSGWQSVAWGFSPRINCNVALNPRSGWQSRVTRFCRPLRGFVAWSHRDPGAEAPGYKLPLLRSWNSWRINVYFVIPSGRCCSRMQSTLKPAQPVLSFRGSKRTGRAAVGVLSEPRHGHTNRPFGRIAWHVWRVGWTWCCIESRFQLPQGHAAALVWALSDRVDVGVLGFWRDCFGPLRRYVP